MIPKAPSAARNFSSPGKFTDFLLLLRSAGGLFFQAIVALLQPLLGECLCLTVKTFDSLDRLKNQPPQASFFLFHNLLNPIVLPFAKIFLRFVRFLFGVFLGGLPIDSLACERQIRTLFLRDENDGSFQEQPSGYAPM